MTSAREDNYREPAIKSYGISVVAGAPLSSQLNELCQRIRKTSQEVLALRSLISSAGLHVTLLRSRSAPSPIPNAFDYRPICPLPNRKVVLRPKCIEVSQKGTVRVMVVVENLAVITPQLSAIQNEYAVQLNYTMRFQSEHWISIGDIKDSFVKEHSFLPLNDLVDSSVSYEEYFRIVAYSDTKFSSFFSVCGHQA